MSKRIVHISTVHSWQDPRIYYKECRSLARYGFDVHLITKDGIDKRSDGVMIHSLTKQPFGRIDRYINSTRKIYKQAAALKPDLIHFHDPELIPGGLRAAKNGQKVIYDIHEDNTTSVHQREYIPALVKSGIGKFIDYLEQSAYKNLNTIIAEKYYSRRFPNAVPILNFPDLNMLTQVSSDNSKPALIYTGNIRVERGAINHTKILNHIPNIELHQIGRCTSGLKKKLMKISGEHVSRLKLTGINRYVPYPDIISAYNSRHWLAGLALFPYDPHFEEKHLTKFFEYMAAGIPIIYSNFTEWKRLLDPLDVGIAVDPEDSYECSQAVNQLLGDSKLWEKFSQNGKRHAAKSFRWGSEEKKLLSFYKKVLT